jgi:hypothetical protein
MTRRRKLGLLSNVLTSNNLRYQWYLGGPNASDSNTGRSYAEAFATVAKVLSVVQAGERVGVVPGYTWREQFSAPFDNVSLEALAVEPGNEPTFDCRDIFPNAGWSKTADKTNVYQVAVTHPTTGLVDPWLSVWEDGVRLARAASVDACDAAPGSYFPSSDSASPATMYVHASDSSDVTTNGAVYLINVRFYGYTGNPRSGCYVKGIRCIGNLSGSGSLIVSPGGSAHNCRASEGGKHNFFLPRNSEAIDCEADEAQFSSGITLFVFHSGVAEATDTVLLSGCYGHMANYQVDASAFFGHSDPVLMNLATLRNCRAVGMGVGFGGQATNLIFESCITDDCGLGFNFAGPAGNISLLNCQHLAGRTNGRAVYLNHASILTATIDNLDARINGSTSSVVGLSAGTNQCALDIRNSHLTMINGSGTRYGIVCLNGTSTIYARSNTFVGLDLQYECGANAPAIDSDLNTFNTGARWRHNNTIYTTLANWKAAGFDPNSVQA